MQNSIADYYTNELVKWDDNIIYYNNEMEELGNKLVEVINGNSIAGITQKVEAHQSLLNHASVKFYNIETEIEQQEATLKADCTSINDKLINDEIELQQIKLRNQMKAAEKEYIDIKFDCYNFISGTLKKS